MIAVRHNRPDITVINEESKEALLDILVSNNFNIQNKYNEKLCKIRGPKKRNTRSVESKNC